MFLMLSCGIHRIPISNLKFAPYNKRVVCKGGICLGTAQAALGYRTNVSKALVLLCMGLNDS